jgi:quinol monooxygenase YgiN
MEDPMLALVVRFEIKEGCVDAFDRLVQRTLDGIRSEEDGTLMYVSSRVAEGATSRVFVEIYRDKEAFTAHEDCEHTREFLREREQLLESYRVEFLTPIDGKFPSW